jgi:hypothetical protein
LTYREIELVESTIEHGRLYFSTKDVKFFPSDSFADRERSGHKGKPVTFRAGSRDLETDIRVLSKHRIGPRKSFGFFWRQVRAKPGSRVRVTRTSPRTYTVEYLP